MNYIYAVDITLYDYIGQKTVNKTQDRKINEIKKWTKNLVR